MDNAKFFLIAQQSELNAAILYKALAEHMENDSDRQLMLSLAADEGHHAAILKKFTQKSLKPKNMMKNVTIPVYKILGKKIIFSIMAAAESSAAGLYKNLCQSYPELKQISDDEAKHGKLLKQALKSK